MPKVTIVTKPPVPVKPEVEKVVLEMSLEEAINLAAYLGHRTSAGNPRGAAETFPVFDKLTDALWADPELRRRYREVYDQTPDRRG